MNTHSTQHDLDTTNLADGSEEDETSFFSYIRERVADFGKLFEEDRKHQSSVDHTQDTDRLKKGGTES